MPTISFVIPVKDEEEVLPELHRRLDAVAREIQGETEFIFVDDGSTDRSREVMSELRGHDERVKLLFLARNFGHQLAISAGLDFASGDAVVIIDGDLQDPPEVGARDDPPLARGVRGGPRRASPARAARAG